MQESALGSVFIFRGRSIGLDNYKGKESLSRVVVLLVRVVITLIHMKYLDHIMMKF